jgi:NAD(P)-dependent dehydrogenase (short-subunit alcohol dehydrogenase family)
MSGETRDSDLSERTVIVTGAGSNLGRAMALRLLHDGFRCVLAGLDHAQLKQTVQLSGANSPRAAVIECDIRDPKDRTRLVAAAVEQPGKLFGLVNNAGIVRFRPLLEETLEDWRVTFETNLEAAFFLSQLAIAEMRGQRRGRVVNIASINGIVGINNQGRGAILPETSEGDHGPVRGSAYASSKGGLIQLTRDLAVAVGPWGITVNSVSPGTIPPKDLEALKTDETPGSSGKRFSELTEEAKREVFDALALQTPLRRLGTAEDIAGPVRFLFSDDAAYITGANLVVDGGFTAW